MSMNSHTLVGNLGKDPESKADGKVAKFSIATDRRVKNGDDWETKTDWHNCVAFGRDAENILKYFKKGSGIIVVGETYTEKYTKQDGSDGYSTETRVFRWSFPPGSKASQGGAADSGDSGGGSGGDSDLPF